MDSWDVVVIGAGMAGLTCARALTESGQKVLVLEARERVGGRIATLRVEGQEPVELGAEFVHGRPPELLALIAEAGCSMYERAGGQVCFEEGWLDACEDSVDAAFDPLEELKTFAGEDVSFRAYLDSKGVTGEQRDAALGYVEGFNAADAELASARALGVQQMAEDAIGGDAVYRVGDGYDQLPEFLSRRTQEGGSKVRLGARVRRVVWEQGRVQVMTEDDTVVCQRVVVTVPLGVLLGRRFVIEPEPLEVTRVAEAMRTGDVCRFTMTFRSRFWERLEPQLQMSELSFLFTFGELPPVWWTTHPGSGASLTGWVGGPKAKALLGRDAAELGKQGCVVLARVFGLREEQVQAEMTGCYTHDWSSDESSRGAYSYVGVGGTEASALMSEPVMNTLFFAGEHTDVTAHWGTVHGAMRSGLRAAEQVLRACAAG